MEMQQRQAGAVGDQEDAGRNAVVRQRSELEAKLLAYRCGWLARDEIKIRKLQRELDQILKQIGTDDALARHLLSAKF
jgi:hypothetical protein